MGLSEPQGPAFWKVWPWVHTWYGLMDPFSITVSFILFWIDTLTLVKCQNTASPLHKPAFFSVLFSELDERCNGLWAAMGLFCQSGHLWILLCSELSFGSVEWVSLILLNILNITEVMVASCCSNFNPGWLSCSTICFEELSIHWKTKNTVAVLFASLSSESFPKSEKKPRLEVISRSCVRSSS